jgi:hypothetical protein
VNVGSPATVIVEAQDNDHNIQSTYQNDVTLNVSGTATGGGLVDIVNGVGFRNVTDNTAETVSLSLSDTQSTGLDVSSIQNLEFVTHIVSFGFGGGARTPTPPSIKGVQLFGKAFSGAKVSVLQISSDSVETKQQGTAQKNGTFGVVLNDISSGNYSYGLVASDKQGRNSQIKIYDANLINQNSLLTVGGILLSPTIGVVRPVVTKGDTVGFIGTAIPGYTVEVFIDGNSTAAGAGIADSNGNYKIFISTGDLDFGSHTAKARQDPPIGIPSDFTPQVVFNVTNLLVPKTDFNEDGSVNISDASIFLSRWMSTDSKVKILDDLNSDGKVDITDFSIFVRTLKLTQ